MVIDMQNSKYDLYFFYYNRKKIRDSFFLDAFPKQLKEFILKNYIFEKYKFMDKLIIASKLILFSIFYFVIYKATSIPDEFAQVIPYTIYFFISFFGTLTLLDYNKKAIPDIEHDHYFRMIGDNRNDLVREVMNRRIMYSFTNWIIPFTLFPFIYASISGGFQYFALYFVFTVLFYLITKIIIFISQRILFDYVKGIVIVDTIVVFVFVMIILGFSLLLTIVPAFAATVILNSSIEIIVKLTVYSLLILILYYLSTKIYNSSLKYSLTNSVILKKKSRVKTNQIKNPNMFLQLLFGKNDFQNKLLAKDLITYYRKSKQEFVTMIIMGGASLIYSSMLVATMFSDDSILGSTMFIDNIFIVLVSIFFIMNLYRMKDTTWYSSEGLNLLIYSKMGFDKYQIYKEKLKLNYLILSPLVIAYIFLPLFFTFNMDSYTIGYILMRIPLLYLFFTNIIDYSIIQDVLNPRKNKYDIISGMGSLNLIILIIVIQGFGLSYVFLNIGSESFLFSGIKNLELITYFVLLFIMIILKLQNRFTSKKLIGKIEGGKIYG